jgi:hypothetical protein
MAKNAEAVMLLAVALVVERKREPAVQRWPFPVRVGLNYAVDILGKAKVPQIQIKHDKQEFGKIGNLLCPDPGDLQRRRPQSVLDIPGPNGCRKALASAEAKPLLMKCIQSPRRPTRIFGDVPGSELVSASAYAQLRSRLLRGETAKPSRAAKTLAPRKRVPTFRE